MNTIVLFGLEVALCLGISFIVIALLRPLLRDVLTDTCGTEKRAEFWVMFTQLMLIISPLLVVVFFAHTTPIAQLYIAYELQQTLFRTLLGDFIALSVIGKVIWKSINSPYNPAMPQPIEGTK